MLAPGWGTGTRGGSPPGVKPISVLVLVVRGDLSGRINGHLIRILYHPVTLARVPSDSLVYLPVGNPRPLPRAPRLGREARSNPTCYNQEK